MNRPGGWRARSVTHYLTYAGAAGTVMLLLNGLRLGVGRLGRRGALSELFIIVPLWAAVGAWILSPYWGASRLQRSAPASRLSRVVMALAVLAVIAFGANSFLATAFFVGGPPHPTADGVTIVLIPMIQWFVLGVAGLLLRLDPATRGLS